MPPARRLPPPRSRGFSLVELLTVMAVVAILAGVAIVGFGGINRAAKARNAADLAASMALSARIEALSIGLGALLVIDNGDDPNNRLQRVAIFRKVSDPQNPSQTILQLVGQPVRLQPGTFFLRNYSRGYFTTNVSFPGGSNVPVLAFEFSGTGHAVKASDADDLRLVFGAGPLDGSDDPLAAMADLRAGFLLRPNGRPTYFSSPETMPRVGS